MIDLHSHILPGVDDGAQNLEESLNIANQLVEAGFRTVFATPHVLEGKDFLSCKDIRANIEKLKQTLVQEGITLNIIPGAECYLFPDLPKWVAQDKVMTLGDMKKHILVELPMLEVPTYTEKVFFDLQVMGITPILAHPERNKELSETPERLVEWAKRGVLFQLNLRSIDGRYGEKVSQFAKLLIENQLVHFIGSDAHRVTRGRTYRNALEELKQLMGINEFEQVTGDLPNWVLKGERVEIQKDYRIIRSSENKTNGIWKKIIGLIK